LSGSGKALAGNSTAAEGESAVAIDAQRPGDIFEVLLADVFELGIELPADLAVGVFRDADAAGLGNAFEPGRDIDAIADDVVALREHVAKMDADAQIHPAIGPDPSIALRHQLLQRNGALHGADHRAELD
jgi:hypothetical protein